MRMALEVAALFFAAVVLGALVVVCARMGMEMGMGRRVVDYVGGGH